jgi:hypothetical protein
MEILSAMLVFSSGLNIGIAPLTFSLVSSPPLPCVNKYTVHTYTVCTGGGGVWDHRRQGGLRQKVTCRQVPLLVTL